MKHVKLSGKMTTWQTGQILPMALVLLAAAVFIIVPALFSAQISLGINRDVEKDTHGYYAAEAGIADAVWKFKTSNSPFTPSSAAGSYYPLSGTINGLNVQVKLLKYTYSNADNYFIESSALSGATIQAKIIALIIQSGSAGNNIFEQAVASLNGDITMSGGAKIISDDTSAGNYGNIYANGNVSVKPSAIVGGTSCPAQGKAYATGTVTVSTSGGACVGDAKSNQAPISYTLTISNFTGPADAGTNYTSQATSWKSGGPSTYNIGPGYVNGNVTIAGSNTVVLQGNLHVKGTLTIGGSGIVQGPYTIVADDKISISGGSSAQLVAGNIPFIITQSTHSTRAFYVNSVAVAAVIYAPNGGATISGGTPSPQGYNVYGSVIAKSVTISGSSTIKYLAGIHSETQIPGAGTGSMTSLAAV